MSDELTLSEVLGRSISMEWHEAVAVVRGVTECLLRDPGEIPVVPELHEIELSSNGHIDVVGGTRSAEPIRRLGQLLQATLGKSDPPVQLRLIISQATAPSPSFGSIREYDQALEYFERPGRSAVLQALYARAAAAAVTLAGSTSKPTLDSIAPLTTPEQQERARIRTAARRRSLRVAVGVGVLAVAAAAGVRYARDAGVVPVAHDVLAMARQFSSKVGASVLSGVSTITERAGLGRLVSRDATDAEASAPAAASPASPSAARPAARGRPSVQTAAARGRAHTSLVSADPPAVPVVAFDLQPALDAVVPSAAGAVDDAVPAALAREDSPGKGKEDVTIYSPESPGVVPPVGVRPQLPTELPPSVNRENLLTIELVVLPDGTVGSVRLTRAPTQMSDLIWLSAVKAFEFQPAMKGGVPVSYRKTVWIATH